MAIIKPDLLKYNCRTLGMRVNFRIEEEQYKKLIKLFGQETLRSLIDISSYRIKGKKRSYYYLALFAQGPQKHKQIYYALNIHIMYFPKPIELPPISLKRVKGKKVPIFNIMDSLQNKQIDSTVEAEFIYPKKSYSSMIGLPIIVNPDLFDENYAEVRGMRFGLKNSAKEKKPKYSHVVELQQNNDIRHFLSFKYKNKINPTILEDVLKYAVNLSGRVIRKRSK